MLSNKKIKRVRQQRVYPERVFKRVFFVFTKQTMDLFGAHMRHVLRNQIQREPLQVKMSQNTGPSPLLRDTGGFTLPPDQQCVVAPEHGRVVFA